MIENNDKKNNNIVNKVKKDQENGARRAVIEDLFYDTYSNRVRIYHVNFIRGIYFGFGSVLGGTLLIGIFIWILGKFSDSFPFVQNIIDLINSQSS